MKLELKDLTRDHQKELEEFVMEFKCNHELEIPGASSLETMSFEEWFKRIQALASKNNIPKGLVPSTLKLAYDHNQLVGIIDMRHYLNEGLLKSGGHIGYSVRPTQRKKGYASAMMKEALKFYKQIHVDKVLLCCLKDNRASQKTIIHSGGVLENEIQDGEDIYLRYWINVEV